MDVLNFGDDRDFAHFKQRIAELRRSGQEVQIAGLLVFVRPTAPSEQGGDWATADSVRDLLIPSKSKDIEVT